MICEKCKQPMEEINCRKVMAELDEDDTDGQMADYNAALLSGDISDWETTETTYRCNTCKEIIIFEE